MGTLTSDEIQLDFLVRRRLDLELGIFRMRTVNQSGYWKEIELDQKILDEVNIRIKKLEARMSSQRLGEVPIYD